MKKIISYLLCASLIGSISSFPVFAAAESADAAVSADNPTDVVDEPDANYEDDSVDLAVTGDESDAIPEDEAENLAVTGDESVSPPEDETEELSDTGEDEPISFYAYIRHSLYDYELTAYSSTKPLIYTSAESTDHLWYFEQVDGIYYKVISAEYGTALTSPTYAEAEAETDGIKWLYLSDYEGADTQLWEFVNALDNGTYSLRLKYQEDEALALDVANLDFRDTAWVMSYSYHGSTAQSFQFFDEEGNAIDVLDLGKATEPTIPTTCINVEDVSAHPGQTIEVPITITGNEGIAGFQIKLSYDKEKLIPESIEAGDVISGSIASNLNADIDKTELNAVTALLTTNGSTSDTDGTLFTVTFKIVSSTGSIGKIPVEISQHKIISESRTVNVITGSGTISSTVLYGDVYSDGEIDIRDLLRLRQYVAEYPISLTDYELMVAHLKDARGIRDTDVDVMDVLRLSQYLAGWSGVSTL